MLLVYRELDVPWEGSSSRVDCRKRHVSIMLRPSSELADALDSFADFHSSLRN